MKLETAKKIMKKNFIGPEELSTISLKLGIVDPIKAKLRIPKIPFTEQLLRKNRNNAVLILGMPKAKNGKRLTINVMRVRFGLNPKKVEPCFYNQDWYLKEEFAIKSHLQLQWYLVSKKVMPNTRGKDLNSIKKSVNNGQALPLAVLAAFTFFAYYFHTKGSILWKHDFVWCRDKDKNGDQIYVGRYHDPKAMNKSGFNIHRLLTIRSFYGLAPEIRN